MLGSSHLDVAVVAHGVEVCLDPAVHAEGRGGAVRHQGVGGVGARQAWGGGGLFFIFQMLLRVHRHSYYRHGGTCPS